jgi:4-amino-4-deoxy-L-arabinose transferase-like glycosyltransferase
MARGADPAAEPGLLRRLYGALARHWPLWLALALGLALRAALWGRMPRIGLIGDEAEYLAAADWLAVGRGFAWHTQYLWTRAPLYPLFLAAHIASFGRDLAPIFVTQTLLSLLNVALVYALGLRLGGDRGRIAAGIAATLSAVYLPLATYAQLLLSETLFISLLLGAFLALGWWAEGMQNAKGKMQNGEPWQLFSDGLWLPLAAAGLLLGLATLTRGLTLGFMPLAAAWILWVAWRAQPNLWHSVRLFCILPFAFCIVLLPWTLYASRAYGGLVVVDTTGAYNLALGARTAFDGGRSDEPTRNFVLALLDPTLSGEARRSLLTERRTADGDLLRAGSCLYEREDPQLLAALERPAASLGQAERQRLLNAEAGCLLRAAPLAFVTKSLTELVDLFAINYTGDERLSKGFALGRLPPWYAAALLVLDDTIYVLCLPLAVLGWAVLRMQNAECGMQKEAEQFCIPHSAFCILIGLWLLYNLAAAPLLFAINRFRVPLMPFVFVLAGCALAATPRLRPALRTRYGAACAALAGLLWLVAASPHAYLEPRPPGADARWASYLGPYPSSLASTGRAWAARPGYLREQELAAALGAGDVAGARAALAAAELPAYAAAVGAPLLDGLEGRPQEGLARLASGPARPLEPWQTALVAGELFRQSGDLDAARRELNPELVDRENPVAWAWQWLAPPRLPGDRIELADDNDLGYIRGFYLGEFDQALGATLRWGGGEAALRFPGAGTGAPRELCLRVGAAWPADLQPPTIALSLDGAPLGAITPGRQLDQHCVALPARPDGASYAIMMRSPTFVPDALDLLKQQGPLVGQLRLLAFQLDWAEVR